MAKNAITLILVSFLCLPIQAQQPSSHASPNRQTRTTSSSAKTQKPEPVDDDVVRITTNLVAIDAVVTKDDKIVNDLKPEDFEIFEDGKRQEITNFSWVWSVPKPTGQAEPSSTSRTKPSEAIGPVRPVQLREDQPHRTIAIVVDDLGISLESMGQVRKQVRKFIDEEMRADDLVAIWRTGGQVGALQQFTTDKRVLQQAANNLKWNPCSRVGTTILQPRGLNFGARLCSDPKKPLGGTVDALKFILQGMREMNGRKSMILLSEHLPTDNPETSLPSQRGGIPNPEPSNPGDAVYGYEAALRSVAELAIRASVVIYGADTSGIHPIGPTAADNTAILNAGGPSGVNLRPTGDQAFATLNLQRHTLIDNRFGLDFISRNTGGFSIRNSNNFGLNKIVRDQEGYYLIGYRPNDETFDRKFHHIAIKVKRSGMRVRTRSGFFGLTDEDTKSAKITEQDKMNLALISPFGASDIEVHLTALFANLPNQGSMIRSLVHFPVDKLTFTDETDGSHKTTLSFVGEVFGDNGRVVQRVNETRELKLDQKEIDLLSRNGLVYQFDLPMKEPGAFQFRVAVRDDTSGRIGTAGEFIEVPNLSKRLLTMSGVTVSGDQSANFGSVNGPAIRRFRVGTNLLFGYVVYNAETPDSLTGQAKLYRDGQLVYTGQQQSLSSARQTDLQRLNCGGGIQLGSTLAPGDYVLQVTVTENSGEKKFRTTSQWIDFELTN